MKKSDRGWRMCIVIFIILTIISFSPLIIPQGQFKPELFGIPYTMWTGFLITISLVVLTFIGTKLHPGTKEKEEDKT